MTLQTDIENPKSADLALESEGAQAFTVEIATDAETVRDSQRLRYEVFALEMGAEVESPEPGIEADAYDGYCRHILVRHRRSGKVAASTRVLLDEDARKAGGFYSESEFDLTRLLAASGRIMEIGRTCVHKDFRSGSAISLLWSGLARFIDVRAYEYMIGCASVPLEGEGANAWAVYELLAQKYLIDAESRVIPRRPLPDTARQSGGETRPALPPLLKAYIRLGAKICGEPCWDPKFNTADLMIALSPADLQKRYARHFLGT